jgi:putative spermidine/putrescine transport system substrate-binding protein
VNRIGRKAVCLSAVAASTIAVAGCGSSGSGDSGGSGSKVVYINSSGGDLDVAYRTAFWDPFTKATGIKVVESAPVDETKLATMVKTDNMQWDITEVSTGGDLARDAGLNYLQKLDKSKLPADQLLPGALTDYGVLDSVAAYVVAWDLSKWPLSGKHPESTSDLWNQTDFPGKRCIFKDAQFTSEIAVMSAGVAQSDVYPLDQTVVYKQLDALKPNVALWYTSPAQSIQALLAGDCVMAATFNGRVFGANIDGDKLGISFKNAASDPAYWAVPKGAPDYDNAMKLLAYMQDPKRQAVAANMIAYSGGNKDTPKYINPNAVKYFATAPDNLSVTLKLDDDYWAKNATQNEQDFTAWITK